jgi:FkbM family methyltransferase
MAVAAASCKMLGKLYQSVIEKFKYLTALWQIEGNRLAYLRAVGQYGFGRKVLFPATFVRLRAARFAARQNSLDIAHLSNYFEPETTDFLLGRKPGQFIDVGAHVGRYSVLLAMQGSRVLAVEPNGGNFAQLSENIRLNGLSERIAAVTVGCSETAERRDLFCVPANEGGASFVKRSAAATVESCELRPLDALCEGCASVDVIKVDVEGFELNVLKGAVRTLEKHRPLLIVEIFGEQQEKEIGNFLKGLGYAKQSVLDSRNFCFARAA